LRRVLEARGREVLVVDGRAVDDPFREAVVRATGRTRSCAAPDPAQAARDLVAGLGDRALILIETERRAWGTAIASELLRSLSAAPGKPSFLVVWLSPSFTGVDIAAPFEVPSTLSDDDLDRWWRAAGSEAASFARKQRRSPAAPWVASDKLEDAEQWFTAALSLPVHSAPRAPELSPAAQRLLAALVLARRAWPSSDLGALLDGPASRVAEPANLRARLLPALALVSHRPELDELTAFDLVAVDAWGEVAPTSRALSTDAALADAACTSELRRIVALALEDRGAPRVSLPSLGFRGEGFRGEGFRGEGFRGEGFRGEDEAAAPLSAPSERDPWSLTRAAELYAELGDIASAERAAHAALASLADAPARDDLWSRWICCLEASDDPERAARLVRSSELALRVGHVDIALRLARDAAAAAPGDHATLLAMGRALAARGDLVGAGIALERALEAGTDDDDRCSACVELAEVRYGTGDLEGAEWWAERAMGLGGASAAQRAASASARISARNVLGKVLLARGAWSEAEVHFASDAIESTCANDRVAELRAKTNRAIALLSNGRLDEARQMLMSVHDVGEARGELRAVTFALTNLATIATLQHRYADALGLSERAFHAYRRLGERVRLAPLATNLAELRLRLGLVDEAEHGLRFGMKACGGDLPAVSLAQFSLVSAQIQLARGRTQAAATALAAALAGTKIPDRGRSWIGPTGILVSQCRRLGARIALEDGDVARAAKMLDQARREPPSVYARAEIAILDAAVEQASGQPFSESAAAALELAREADDVEFLVEAHALVAESFLVYEDAARASGAVRAARVVRDEIATSLPESLRAAYLSRRHAPDLDRLEARVERARRTSQAPGADEVVTVPPLAPLPLEARVTRLSAPAAAAFSRIVGHDPAIRSLLAAVPKVAASDATVLVYGESGTGKELVAEAIHASSPRASGPLVKVNCAALVETLLLSELFGHEKGAFTGAAARRRGRFEAAEGGTLFLDEIGDISSRTQVALLRVLQDKTFERVGGTTQVRANVRIVCATHRDLQMMVARGEFREDLYYRLRGVVLEVPSLRQRIGDLPVIASSLLERLASERHEQVKHLSPRAAASLAHHSWPGNIRELENALRAAALFAEGDLIELEDLTTNVQGLKDLDGSALRGQPDLGPPTLRAMLPPQATGATNAVPCPTAPAPQVTDVAYSAIRGGISLGDMKRRIERECISRALGESDGNITKAALLLGMKRPRLSQLVKQYGLQAGSDGGVDRDEGTTDEGDSLDSEEV